jgi:hypothetical protein
MANYRYPIPFPPFVGAAATQLAHRTRLVSARLSIDLCHSPAGEWLRLEPTTTDGRRLRYRRLAATAKDRQP